MIDYAVIAKICHEILISSKVKIAFVNTLARYLTDVDPDFDKTSFKKACDNLSEYQHRNVDVENISLNKAEDALAGREEAVNRMKEIVQNVLSDVEE